MDFSIDEAPAVKSLGPLFKLTEVHLWDDGSSEVRDLADFQEPVKLIDGGKDYANSNLARFKGFSLIPEDVVLAKELNDLGLPLSFQTNKEMRLGVTSGKRKSRRNKNQQRYTKIDGFITDSIKPSNEEENTFPASLIDTSRMLDESEILRNGIVAHIDRLSNLCIECGDLTSSTACTSNEHDCISELYIPEFDHSSPCTNLHLDGGNSERSCLINEVADCDGKEINEELDTLLTIDHDNEGQSNEITLEVIQELDVAYSQFSEQASSNISGEWIPYCDEFYARTFFYNVETGESTWDPPPGMENFVYGNIDDEQTIMADGQTGESTWDPPPGMENFVYGNIDDEQTIMADGLPNQVDFGKPGPDEVQASSDLQPRDNLDQESRNDNGSLCQQLDGTTGNRLSADNVSNTSNAKRKKKVRRTKSNRKLSVSSEDLQGVVHEVPPSISKYWWQRYLLFSRFDHGIKMDEEGWFSVTPEPLAKHHAARCGNGVIVDFFTGVGGNAIQFAQWSKHVIAIDIDPYKIDYARHNAAIYGVDDSIDFMKGDSFSLAPKLKANTVFMSPPWGGPDYSKVKKFDINTMLKPRDGQFLFDAGKGIAPKIVMFLPRNVDINQLAELSLSATPPWSLEVEMNFLNGRLKAVTAYFLEPSVYEH
ncbi:hypothetical protein OROGR_032951 [Orobanche gracilis]